MAEQILSGIEEIRPHVGNVSESTIMNWRIQYESFPLFRRNGIWCAYLDDLQFWYKTEIESTTRPARRILPRKGAGRW